VVVIAAGSDGCDTRSPRRCLGSRYLVCTSICMCVCSCYGGMVIWRYGGMEVWWYGGGQRSSVSDGAGQRKKDGRTLCKV